MMIWLRRIEDALLVVLLTSMIGVAVAQIFLRNFFDSGLYWGDAAVRVMVLWVAMVGAMLASRNDEHIRIDIAERFLADRFKMPLKRFVNLCVCLLLALFAWHSAQFVRFEYEDQTIAFGIVPAWMCELVMPVAAGIMALRYLYQVWQPR